MTLILLLAPALLFIAVRILAHRRRMSGTLLPAAAGSVAAALATLLIFVTLAYVPRGIQDPELAWTGISEADGRGRLVIGGAREQAVIGWPSGLFSPKLEAELHGDTINLEISGGGAFVEYKNTILNGKACGQGQRLTIDDFQLEMIGRQWWRPWKGTLFRISHRDAPTAAEFFIDSRGTRVYSFDPLVAVSVARLRKDKKLRVAADLESWAFGRRLFVRNNRDFRVLGLDDSDRASVPSSADLRIHWAGLSQRLTLKSDEGILGVRFDPPWRLSSPLPSSDSSGIARLTVTGRAVPGDVAFLVPLGSALTGKSETVSIKDLRFDRPEKNMDPALAGLLSQRLVRLGDVSLRISILQDLPPRWRIGVALGVALALFGWGLFQLQPRMRPDDVWTLSGILLALWSLLLLRFLLAFRYALEPAHLDEYALTGVGGALVALTLLPGAIVLAARLRHDRKYPFPSRGQKTKAGNLTFLYAFAVLFGGTVAETEILGGMWPNLKNMVTSGWEWGLIVGLLGGIVALRAVLIYRFEISRLTSPRLRQAFTFLKDRIVEREPLKTLATETGREFWKMVGATSDDVLVHREPTSAERKAMWINLLKILAYVAVGLLGLVVFFGVFGRVKVGQEIIGPLLACWLPALLWLTIRQRFSSSSTMSKVFNWPFFAGLAVLAFLLPVFLFPILLRDTGGMVSTLSVFLPLLCLLAAGGSPRRVWAVPALAVALAFVAASLLYLNLQPLLPVAGHLKFGLGEAPVRLLVFKKGGNAAADMLRSAVLSEDSATPARKIGEGLEHAWENTAIAHQGKLLGLGYGEAPTRRSRVPQQTLAADSTFSFYILSEFGVLGSLCLLLIYSIPLAFTLWSARARFDVGQALAILVASAFLLEALAQAATNLGIVPFTGRNLPLLAVGSKTDFLKWLVLFSIAARALLWRNKNLPTGFATPFSIITNEHEFVARGQESAQEPWPRYLRSLLVMTALPLLGVISVVVVGCLIVQNSRLEQPFDWSGLSQTVRDWVHDGDLWFDRQANILKAKPHILSGGETLLEQEMERFNALTDDEKLETATPNGPPGFGARLGKVRNIWDYDKMMDELRRRDRGTVEHHRPVLFELRAPLAFVDEDETLPAVDAPYDVRVNPAYYTRTDFRKHREIPSVSFRDTEAGTFLLTAGGAEIAVPVQAPTPGEHRVVTLEKGVGASLHRIEDTSPGSSRGKLVLRFYGPAPPRKGKRPRTAPGAVLRTAELGEFEIAANRSLMFQPGLQMDLVLKDAAPKRVHPGVRVRLTPGSQLRLAAAVAPGFQPAIDVSFSNRGALIGAAWVNGEQVAVFDPDPVVPWTAYLNGILPGEASRLGPKMQDHYRRLTLDRRLQQVSQKYVTDEGRNHYNNYLQTRQARLEPQPPRMGIAVIKINGEVLALGSWPRMSSDRDWKRDPAGGWIPPVDWVEQQAPSVLRNRFASDRNFDPVEIGSAGKPIWAAAVLSVHENLNRRLSVSGPEGLEDEVFGIHITNRPWRILHASHSLNGQPWCDFTAYLAESDNRYQIRLGFLGLAVADRNQPAGVSDAGPPGSVHESIDGGDTAWQRYPNFLPDIEFGHHHPRGMRDLDRTPLADRLQHMFSISTVRNEIDLRRSFWTADERHDRREEQDRPHDPALASLVPEAPDFSLNTLKDPRQYVNLLLGGGHNRWANVDLAAAFATVVTGQPVIAHATVLSAKDVHPAADRQSFVEIAGAIRPGLAAVAQHQNGTAHAKLAATNGLAAIQAMPGIQIYAKTGTLRTRKDRPPTSRILIALVHGNPSAGAHGIVIAVYVERADVGLATEIAGRFIFLHQQELAAFVR